MFCYYLFYFDLNQYVNELTLIYYHSFNLELNLNLLISKLILEQRETNTNIWITYHKASGAFLISKEPYINWTQDQLKGFLIRRGFITEPKMMQIKSISIVVETAAGGKTCIRFTASAGSYTPRDTRVTQPSRWRLSKPDLCELKDETWRIFTGGFPERHRFL